MDEEVDARDMKLARGVDGPSSGTKAIDAISREATRAVAFETEKELESSSNRG